MPTGKIPMATNARWPYFKKTRLPLGFPKKPISLIPYRDTKLGEFALRRMGWDTTPCHRCHYNQHGTKPFDQSAGFVKQSSRSHRAEQSLGKTPAIMSFSRCGTSQNSVPALKPFPSYQSISPHSALPAASVGSLCAPRGSLLGIHR